MNIFSELKARGFVQNVTNEKELDALLSNNSIPFYAGYDPTSPSLHIGNLMPTSLLARLQKAGHKPLILIGGATGMIGDPSGRSNERSLLTADILAANSDGIQRQLEPFVEFSDSSNGAVVVNNTDWFNQISILDFLRDIGKHITVNYMTAKESVKSRLLDRDQGISYTEFSYMLLQAYDFAHLAKERGCQLQVGGSDQWGNITTGIELARKMGISTPMYGLTTPLLLDSDGQKMGKTSQGTRIWLDAERTSAYALYQYMLNTDDADVDRLLRLFSWRSIDDIAELVTEHNTAPHARLGQKALADDVTQWVHGQEARIRAITASQVMFGEIVDNLHDADLQPLLGDVPSTRLAKSGLEHGIELLELLHTTGLAKSKGEARRLVSNGGAYVNNIRVSDASKTLTCDDLATESMLLLRCGKKKYHLIQVY